MHHIRMQIYDCIKHLMQSCVGPLPKYIRNYLGNLFHTVVPDPYDSIQVCRIEEGSLCDWLIHLNPRRSYPYLKNLHEPEVVSWLQDNCMPGMKAVDVGAHVGYISLLLAKLVGGSGHVYSFEPVSDLFKSIQLGVELNNLSHVTVVNKVVSSEIGFVTLNMLPQIRAASHSAMRKFQSSAEVEFPAISLDHYFEAINWPHIDIVKIDVEGFELAVIQGMRTLLEKFSPFLVLEIHFWVDPGPLIKLLQHHEYVLCDLQNEPIGSEQVLRSALENPDGTMNIVALPKEKVEIKMRY